MMKSEYMSEEWLKALVRKENREAAKIEYNGPKLDWPLKKQNDIPRSL